MKRILLLCISFLSMTAFGQIESSSFTSTGRGGATTFVTDYQALGINPANLGWASKFEDKKFTMGFNEITYSIHSGALSKQELRDEFTTMIRNKSTKSFTIDEKRQAAVDFANTGFALNLDYGSFGFGFAGKRFGGIAFRINDNIGMYSRFNEATSDIMFMGKGADYFDSLVFIDSVTLDTVSVANYENMDPDSISLAVSGYSSLPKQISELFAQGQGTEISFSWIREYNLSYGRKIIEKDSLIAIFAGVGVKYLQGNGMIDIHTEDGELIAFSSLSPSFGFDYGSAAALNPSSLPSEPFSILPKPVGNGFGVDLGVNVLLFNKLKVGLSAVNIGSMTWTGNVYTVKDTLIVNTESTGMESYNVASEIGNIIGTEGVLEWNGEEERTVALPTTVRFGASYEFGKIAELGFDAILPTNDVPGPGSYENAIIGFGGHIKPIPWLRISAGFLTGGNYDYSVPVGITIITKKGSYEAGIASRDAVTFFTQNGPTLSLSTGFMRFRF